jgi:regulator of RNase E activity RraB
MPSVADLRNRFAMDGAVKQSLRSNSDDEAKIRAVDHHFIADASKPLEELGGCAGALGFRFSEISEEERDGIRQWSIDITSDRDTKLILLTRESILMLAIAEAFGATYDGWETQIVE